MIRRKALRETLHLLKYFPVVGITGPRQCGKTTLAKELAKKIRVPVVYIDLESPTDREKLSDTEFFLNQHINQCVIIDEVQLMPELFSVMRSSIDKKRVPARFILLGSASPQLIRNSSESLAGRIAYFELAPFNIQEISSLKKHWLRGGYPESFLSRNEQVAFKWLADYIKTYTERDLPLLGFNLSPPAILKLWKMIANYHGNILNQQEFSRALGVTIPTISRYFDFMEQAFLIHRLPSFFMNISKRLVKAPKIYISDSGILHSLIGYDNLNDLQHDVKVGASWEGYAIEQVKQLCQGKFDTYYYRTHHGAECDLVLVKGSKPQASVEIKYTSTPQVSKGLLSAVNDLKTKNNFIVTFKSEDYKLSKTMRVCSLADFVEKHFLEI